MLLVCLAGLEIAGRVLFQPPQLPPPLVPDPETGWALPISAQVQAGPASLRTNSLGLRGHEPGDIPDLLRVLVLGDSSAFGWMVTHRDSFAGELEAMLAMHGPVDVQNGGVPGFTCPQSLALYRRVRDRIPPDVLVVYSLTSDKRMASTGDWPLAEPVFGPLGLVGMGRLASQISLRMRAARDAPLSSLRLYRGCMDELVAEQLDHGGRVVLTVPLTVDGIAPPDGQAEHQDEPEALHGRYVEVLEELSERRGVPLLDCAELAAGTQPQDLLLDNVHPNERGHTLIAGALYDLFRDEGWVE